MMGDRPITWADFWRITGRQSVVEPTEARFRRIDEEIQSLRFDLDMLGKRVQALGRAESERGVEKARPPKIQPPKPRP